MWINVRMLMDKIENGLFIPFKDFYDSRVAFFRADLSLSKFPIDGLPIP